MQKHIIIIIIFYKIKKALAHVAVLKEDTFPAPLEMTVEWLKKQPVWDRPNLIRMPQEALKVGGKIVKIVVLKTKQKDCDANDGEKCNSQCSSFISSGNSSTRFFFFSSCPHVFAQLPPPSPKSTIFLLLLLLSSLRKRNLNLALNVKQIQSC